MSGLLLLGGGYNERRWLLIARFFSTVLPPLVLSSLVSFIPQKGIHRAGASTRYQGESS